MPNHLDHPNQQFWPNRAHQRWLLGLVLCTALFLFVARWREVPIGAVNDDAIYIEMARSISEGRGPVIATGPDAEPANPQIFPSGFPLLLSPIAALAPQSLAFFPFVSLIAAIIVVILSWRILGPLAPAHLRVMLVIATLLNPWLISWSSRVLSDLPYTALSIGALLLFLRTEQQHFRPKKSLVLLVMLCAAAVGLRTIGWTLVMAISAVLFIQRRRKFGFLFPLAVAALLAPLWTWGSQASGPLTKAYMAQMFSHHDGAPWRIVLANTKGYIAEIPVLLAPVFSGTAARIFTAHGLGILYFFLAFASGAVLLALAAKGLKKFLLEPKLTARAQLFGFYILFYSIVLSLFNGYPSGVQTRLLLPLMPILMGLILWGAHNARFIRGWQLSTVIFCSMIAASLLHNGWRLAHPLRTSLEVSGHGLVDPEPGADWIRSNSQNSDIIMTFEPLPKHLYWRRQTVHFPATISLAEVSDRCQNFGVKFLFICPSVAGAPRQLDPSNQQMKQLVDSHAERFLLISEDDREKIYIYRVRR